MAQRRPIASHPAFAPLVALWFAALLGLGVAVLPGALVERALAGFELNALTPLSTTGRLVASGVAALVGGLVGLALGRLLARRLLHDPRPIYSEPEPVVEELEDIEPARRPLRVREELADGFDGEPEDSARAVDTARRPAAGRLEEGLMILTPQPAHPPRPAPDLDALLAQFDDALAAYGEDEEPRPAPGDGEPDPVHAFVARQTGAPAPSPLGGTIPDHQAELRAALDKLARAQRGE